MARWKSYIITSVLLLSSCIAITHEEWLPSIYDLLDISEAPQYADWILVLGGGGRYYRLERAVTLFEAGYGNAIVLSGDDSEQQQYKGYLERTSIPAEAIITIDRLPTSTWDEAQILLEMMDNYSVESAIIVTDAFHTRRAQAVYDKQNAQFELFFIASQDIAPREVWWQNELRPNVLNEFSKLFYYSLVYGTDI